MRDIRHAFHSARGDAQRSCIEGASCQGVLFYAASLLCSLCSLSQPVASGLTANQPAAKWIILGESLLALLPPAIILSLDNPVDTDPPDSFSSDICFNLRLRPHLIHAFLVSSSPSPQSASIPI